MTMEHRDLTVRCCLCGKIEIQTWDYETDYGGFDFKHMEQVAAEGLGLCGDCEYDDAQADAVGKALDLWNGRLAALRALHGDSK